MRKLLLLLLVGYAYADGVDALNQFMQEKNNGISANFVQEVFGHKRNQVSHGSMEVLKPNRFRWKYDSQGNNTGQLILSDGKTVYIVDNELQQVTVKTLGKTLDKSPAMLLAGSSDIQKLYIVTDKLAVGANADNLDWASLTPKNASDNNGFQVVSMGFDKATHKIAQMRFIDNFGGKSQVSFTNVQVGVKFKDSEFKYTIPKGYDSIDGN